ncbi:MAG TPA: hypothetical protein VGF17_12705 [Phytomonospora sp.]
MGNTFTPVPNLNAIVARMVAPEVRQIALRVELEAKKLAPGVKRWVSMSDNLVRDTHREAHGQEVPDNLRFEVRGQPWDIEHGLSPGIDYLLHPKDTSTGLPLDSVQHVHCRCITALSPGAIASKVHTGPAEVYGDYVRVVVSCVAVKVIEAEYGDTYPGGITAPGTHFMGRAAARVAGSGGYGPTSTGASGLQRGGPGTGPGDNHG